MEIVFDNCDRRFPIDCDEVRIKRVIGSKKDQFFMNGKLASSRSEVQGTLEAAGFSLSNPYYIVKQGQISKVACCSGKDRLKLVREVAGVGVHTEKRVKCEEELAVTDTFIQKTEESLESVRERLEELGEERAALEDYRRVDRTRRVLELTVLEADIEELNLKKRDLEVTLSNVRSATLKSELQEVKASLEAMVIHSESLKISCSPMERDISSLRKSCDSLEGRLEELRLREADLMEEATGLWDPVSSNPGDLAFRRDSLATSLAALGGSLSEAVTAAEGEEERLALLCRERDHTFARLGRGKQFGSREERDEWIEEQLGQVRAQLEEKTLQLQELESHLEAARAGLAEAEDTEERGATDRRELEEQQEAAHLKLQEVVQERAALKGQLGDTHNRLTKLRGKQEAEGASCRNLYSRLSSLGGLRPIMQGTESIRKVLTDMPELQGSYYGLVIESFSCPDHLFTAIDETVGNKLFHHLVDTDTTATALIREVTRRKLPGVFSFVPLNRVEGRKGKPLAKSKDSFPLQGKLQYEGHLEAAMSFLFGRVLVCRDMATVVRLARETGVDCVTPDGERGSSKGVLSGGYVNREKGRMVNYARYREASRVVQELGQEVRGLEERQEELGRKLGEAVSYIEKTKEGVRRNEAVLSELDVKQQQDETRRLREQVREADSRLAVMEKERKLLELNCRELEDERGEEMESQLTEEQREQSDQVVRRIQEVKANVKKMFKEKAVLEKRYADMKNELESLDKEVTEQAARLQKVVGTERALDLLRLEVEEARDLLERERSRLAALVEQEQEVGGQLGLLVEEQGKVEAQLQELKEELAQERGEQDTARQTVERHQAALDSLVKKREGLVGLNPALLEQYRDTSRKTLVKQLKKVVLELKKYSGVNQKAADQYVTFTGELDFGFAC